MRTHETCMHDLRDPRALVGWRFTPRNRSDSAHITVQQRRTPTRVCTLYSQTRLLHDKSRHLWSWTRLSAQYAHSRPALGSLSHTRTMNVRLPLCTQMSRDQCMQTAHRLPISPRSARSSAQGEDLQADPRAYEATDVRSASGRTHAHRVPGVPTSHPRAGPSLVEREAAEPPTSARAELGPHTESTCSPARESYTW